VTDRTAISRSRVVLFTLLVPLLVLGATELSLRLGGVLFAHWAAPSSQEESGEGALELWAVGDSYTVGIGADDPATESYPVVVGRLLEERTGRQVVVRNFALPGQNSSQVADSLQRELANRSAPDLVLMLAGINNVRWLGKSGQFCLDEAAEVGPSPNLPDWVSSLRLYKLLQQVVARSQEPAAEALSCALIADGFHYLDKGSLAMASEAFDAALSFNPRSRWATVGKAIYEQRRGRPELAIPLFRRAQGWGLNPPPISLALRAASRASGATSEESLTREPYMDLTQEDFAVLLDAWEHLDRGDIESSLLLFESLTETRGERRKMLRGTVLAFAHDGKGWALRRMGRLVDSSKAFDRANELGRSMFIVPHLLGWSHLGLGLNAWDKGNHSLAQREFDLASRDRSVTATSWALEGWMRAGSGGEGCVAAIQLFEDALAVAPAQAQAVEGQRLCAALGAEGRLPEMNSGDGVPALLTMQVPTLQDWIEPSDTRLLESDIAMAEQLVRNAGSQLIVLGYPEPDAHEQLWQGVLRAGRRSGLLVIDSTDPMQEALDGGLPWTQLRIADGHPTSLGYRLMGEQIVDELLRFSPGLRGGH
jgi:lysophospholipase L1-like esterase